MSFRVGTKVRVIKRGSASFGKVGTITREPGNDGRYEVTLEPQVIRSVASSLTPLEPEQPEKPKDLLWVADASKEFSEEWASGNAYDVNRGEGTVSNNIAWARTTRIIRARGVIQPAWCVSVLDGDADRYDSANQRTEMGMGSPPRRMSDGVERRMTEGNEYWFGFRILIPSSYPNSKTWCSLAQIKGANNSGNGPFGIAFWDGRLLIEKSQSQSPLSTNMGRLWQSTGVVPRDRWLKIIANIKWSTREDGHYRLLVDLDDRGGLIERAAGTGWTLKTNSEPGNPIGLRLGIYRQRITGSHSVYYANACCGYNKDSVINKISQ